MQAFGFRGRQVMATVTVALVVALATGVISATLLVRSGVHGIRENAELIGRTVYRQTSAVIRENWSESFGPAIASDAALRRIAASVVGYSPVIVYVAILDDERQALFHSNAEIQGKQLEPELSLLAFSRLNPLVQAWMLCTRSRVLALDLPFSTQEGRALGTVRVAVSTVLLKKQLFGFIARNAAIAAGVVVLVFTVSFYVADRMLAPIERLRKELARVADLELDLRTESDASHIAALFSSMARELSQTAGDPAREPVAGIEEDGIAVVAKDGRLHYLNSTAASLLADSGAPPDRLGPDHPLRGLAVRSFAADRALGPTRLAWQGREHAVGVLARAQPIGGPGREALALLTVRDAEKLSRLKTELAYSRQLGAVGRISSGVTHELKNVLNAIVMHAEVLRRWTDGKDPKLRDAVDVFDRELRRLDKIVETFLQFTRPEDLNLGSVAPGRVIEDAVELVRARAESSGIAIEQRPIEPGVRISGDAELLRQALVNLLLNACDAMPAGGTLTVDGSLGGDGATVCLAVSDTGIGIPPERLQRVFDLFHTTKAGGSGIGLSTAYRVAHLHGGSIHVRSETNRGTCFTLVLPLE